MRAFVDGQFYVLTRVFPDTSAPRQDMVFAHALFLPLDAFCRLGSLKRAKALLATGINKSVTLPVLELEEEASPASPTPGAMTARHVALVQALVDVEAAQPPVWVGQGGFDSVVTALWEHLSPEMRRSFEFSLVFAKANLVGRHFTVVATPEDCATYWPGGYRLVRSHDLGSPIGLSDGYLLGQPEGEAVRRLERDLETSATSFNSLQQLSFIATYLKDAQDGVAGATLDAVRQIGAYVPDPACGAGFKAQLLSQLVDEAAAGGRSSVWGLRNLPLAPFPNGKSFLKRAIQGWVRRNVASLPQHADADVIGTVSDALLQEKPRENPEWKNLFTEALESTLAAWKDEYAVTVWTLWTSCAEVVSSLGPLLPDSSTVESALSASILPTLGSATGKRILLLCQARHWYLLHAATAVAYLPPQDAISKHLEFDQRNTDASALTFLTSKMADDTVVQASLVVQDQRLYRVAAGRIVSNPNLLSGVDLRDQAWQTLLLRSLEAGAYLLISGGGDTNIVFALLDLLISGEQIEPELLGVLAHDPRYSDLCDYESREAALSRMPRSPQTAFVQATAGGWMARFEKDPSSVPAVAGLVRGRITSVEHIRAWLRGSRSTPELVVAFLRMHGDALHIDEPVSEWIRSQDTLTTIQAANIGSLIGDRRWHMAANALAQAAMSHRSWGAGLPPCKSLVTPLVRFQLAFAGHDPEINAGDWWEAWATVSSRLFHDGIEDRRIWSVADGDPSQISLKSPGHTQWVDALRLLRQGGAKRKISVPGLLHRMRNEFPNDRDLYGLEMMWTQNKIK